MSMDESTGVGASSDGGAAIEHAFMRRFHERLGLARRSEDRDALLEVITWGWRESGKLPAPWRFRVSILLPAAALVRSGDHAPIEPLEGEIEVIKRRIAEPEAGLDTVMDLAVLASLLGDPDAWQLARTRLSTIDAAVFRMFFENDLQLLTIFESLGMMSTVACRLGDVRSIIDQLSAVDERNEESFRSLSAIAAERLRDRHDLPPGMESEIRGVVRRTRCGSIDLVVRALRSAGRDRDASAVLQWAIDRGYEADLRRYFPYAFNPPKCPPPDPG